MNRSILCGSTSWPRTLKVSPFLLLSSSRLYCCFLTIAFISSRLMFLSSFHRLMRDRYCRILVLIVHKSVRKPLQLTYGKTYSALKLSSLSMISLTSESGLSWVMWSSIIRALCGSQSSARNVGAFLLRVLVGGAIADEDTS
jgi:hypothetical protein